MQALFADEQRQLVKSLLDGAIFAARNALSFGFTTGGKREYYLRKSNYI